MEDQQSPQGIAPGCLYELWRVSPGGEFRCSEPRIRPWHREGPRPKPAGQARNRNPLVHGWIEVESTPFDGGPDLPPRRISGEGTCQVGERRGRSG